MSQSNGEQPRAKKFKGFEDFEHLSEDDSNNTSQFDSSCDFDSDEMNLLQSPCQETPLKLVKREDVHQSSSQLDPSDDTIQDNQTNGLDEFEENTANGEDEFGEECEEDEEEDATSEEEEGLILQSSNNNSQHVLTESQQQSLLNLMPELLANSVSALPALVLPSLLSRLQVT
jgi:hypothetical protein